MPKGNRKKTARSMPSRDPSSDHLGIPPALLIRDQPRAGDYDATEWADPSATRATARASEADTGQSHVAVRKVRGYRSRMEIDRLRASSPRVFTTALIRSARRLLRDYAIGIEGARTGGRAPVAPPGTSPDDLPGPDDHRMNAAARYRAARAALGPTLADVVCWVVLENWTLHRLALRLHPARKTGAAPNVHRASGQLLAGLQRLLEHYQAVGAEKGAQPAGDISSGFGQPPAEEIDPLLPVGATAPLPAVRLGRWRESHAA